MHFFQNILISFLVSLGSVFSQTDSSQIKKTPEANSFQESYAVSSEADETAQAFKEVLGLPVSSTSEKITTEKTDAPVAVFKVDPVVTIPEKQKPSIRITKSPAPVKKVTLSSVVAPKKASTTKILPSETKTSSVIDVSQNKVSYPSFVTYPTTSSSVSKVEEEKIIESKEPSTSSGESFSNDGAKVYKEEDPSFSPSEEQIAACEDSDENAVCSAIDSENTIITGSCQVKNEFFACVP
jgi:hypothetical protein